MQSALIVQSQHERRRRELLRRRATRGTLTQRGINSDADTQTSLHMNHIKNRREGKGAPKNLFICRFPCIGVMKNSKYMGKKPPTCAIFTFRLIRWGYMKAACSRRRLMPPLSAAGLPLHRFSASANTLMGTYLDPLIDALLHCIERRVSGSGMTAL